jgi:hypothetical protein
VVIKYIVLCSVLNITEKSSTDKTSLPFSESNGGRVGVVSENPTIQISLIKLDGNNYLAWSGLLFSEARGPYGYITGEKERSIAGNSIFDQ